MAPRSRTGKLMQGLFGRFGNKKPAPEFSPVNRRQPSQRSEIDDLETAMRDEDRDYQTDTRFDDGEETNWDDAETLADENNSIVYAQPIVPVVSPPTVGTALDLDDWDEALPAATVKNSNVQEVRRGKNPPPVSPNPDIWDDNLPSPTFSPSSNLDPAPQNRQPRQKSIPNPVEQAIGFWAAIVQQFRRFLPAPIRQLSDPIVTGIVIAIVTITIWFVDGFFIPGIDPVGANPPSGIITTQSHPNSVSEVPQISPEQALIEAIQRQLSEITSQYPDDIIQTLSVDIVRERLIVRLNPIWYLISDDRQNSLTDRMWLQAQANHFTKLEIQDVQGRSIARSPVVGRHPIILQRRQS
jgi:hypothetical protein